MPVPSVGVEKALGKIRQEMESSGVSDDYDDGPYTSDQTTLEQASTYQYGGGLNIKSKHLSIWGRIKY